MAHNSGRFHFDGGAGTYLCTGILAALITIFTLGICYPFALVLLERWRCKHTYDRWLSARTVAAATAPAWPPQHRGSARGQARRGRQSARWRGGGSGHGGPS